MSVTHHDCGNFDGDRFKASFPHDAGGDHYYLRCPVCKEYDDLGHECTKAPFATGNIIYHKEWTNPRRAVDLYLGPEPPDSPLPGTRFVDTTVA